MKYVYPITEGSQGDMHLLFNSAEDSPQHHHKLSETSSADKFPHDHSTAAHKQLTKW